MLDFMKNVFTELCELFAAQLMENLIMSAYLFITHLMWLCQSGWILSREFPLGYSEPTLTAFIVIIEKVFFGYPVILQEVVVEHLLPLFDNISNNRKRQKIDSPKAKTLYILFLKKEIFPRVMINYGLFIPALFLFS